MHSNIKHEWSHGFWNLLISTRRSDWLIYLKTISRRGIKTEFKVSLKLRFLAHTRDGCEHWLFINSLLSFTGMWKSFSFALTYCLSSTSHNGKGPRIDCLPTFLYFTRQWLAGFRQTNGDSEHKHCAVGHGVFTAQKAERFLANGNS